MRNSECGCGGRCGGSCGGACKGACRCSSGESFGGRPGKDFHRELELHGEGEGPLLSSTPRPRHAIDGRREGLGWGGEGGRGGGDDWLGAQGPRRGTPGRNRRGGHGLGAVPGQPVQRGMPPWRWQDFEGQLWSDSLWATSREIAYASLAEASLACETLHFYQIENPDWYVSIPKCPCSLKDLDGLKPPNHTVEEDNKSVSDRYHPGSDKCFRVKYSGQSSGNQCCYDKDKNLITNGAGAGTPDMVGPISPAGALEWPGYIKDLMGHLCYDVFPFDWLYNLEQYLEIRPPYDDDCRPNPPGPGGRKPPPEPKPSEWEQMVRYCESGCRNETFMKASVGDWNFEEADAYYEECVEECIDYFSSSDQ